MLKLKDFLTFYGKLSATALLFLMLAGCGSGGGTDNILCGGDPCSEVVPDEEVDGESTEEIENIVDLGQPDSIEYVDVLPTTISIQGAGGDETGIVTFIITDTAGNPLPDVTVNFELDNTAGGVELSNASDSTNDLGEASAIVQAGTVQTSVRVLASVNGIDQTTVSDPIPISTGITHSIGFDVAFDVLNVEGLDYNNTPVNVTVNLNDFYGNPPADGTLVLFYAESGTIESTCATVGGTCSVTWSSSNPRPGDVGTVGEADGIGQILAYTTGVESFIDVNGNGVYDSGEVFVDLPELFADEYENDIYSSGEFFVDSDPDGSGDEDPNEIYDDVGDGLYNGPLCNADCSAVKTLTIGESVDLVISGSEAFIFSSGGLPAGGISLAASATINYSGIILSDENDNPLPAGTSISVETSIGSVEGDTSFEIPNSQNLSHSSFSFTLDAGDEADSGFLKIETTTPLGTVTRFEWSVTVAAPVI